MPRFRLCAAAVACGVAISALAVPARADTTEEQIERTRAEIAEVADAWFDSQAEAGRIDAEIATLEQQVADARAEAEQLGDIASAQAVELYTGSPSPLAPVFAGEDALASARAAELLDRADDEAQRAIEALNTAAADLGAHREALAARRAAQAQLTGELGAQQDDLDARLAELETQAANEAAARAAEASRQAARSRPTGAAPSAASAPAAPTPVPPAATPVVPEPRGTHPRHDEPFLVCTRDRESGGNYAAVNPSGYYGAYQFAVTTWNVTASQAGRIELVGVLPSRAQEFDQDDLAWVLYEWQGNQPWNGRC